MSPKKTKDQPVAGKPLEEQLKSLQKENEQLSTDLSDTELKLDNVIERLEGIIVAAHVSKTKQYGPGSILQAVLTRLEKIVKEYKET